MGITLFISPSSSQLPSSKALPGKPISPGPQSNKHQTVCHVSPLPDTRLQRRTSVASSRVSRTPRRSTSNKAGTKVVPVRATRQLGRTSNTTHQDHLLIPPPAHPLAVANRQTGPRSPTISKHTQTRVRPEYSTTSLAQHPSVKRPTNPHPTSPGPPLGPPSSTAQPTYQVYIREHPEPSQAKPPQEPSLPSTETPDPPQIVFIVFISKGNKKKTE